MKSIIKLTRLLFTRIARCCGLGKRPIDLVQSVTGWTEEADNFAQKQKEREGWSHPVQVVCLCTAQRYDYRQTSIIRTRGELL